MTTNPTTSALDELLQLLDEQAPGGPSDSEPDPPTMPVLAEPGTNDAPTPHRQALAPVVALDGARDEMLRLRESLTPKALRAAHQAIDVIAETFAAKGADFDDAVKALPVLHKVLEHVERLDQQRKESSADRPQAVLNIILDRNVKQVRPIRPTPTNVTDI